MAQRLKQERPDRAERRIRIRPLYVVLALILAFFAFKFVSKTQQLQQLNRDASMLRAQNRQILHQNRSLRRVIQYRRTDAFIENQARAVLGLTKPGETSIVPRLRYARAAPVKAPVVRYVAPDPAWKQWLHALFG